MATARLDEYFKKVANEPGQASVAGRILQEGKTFTFRTFLKTGTMHSLAESQKIVGHRTALGVPLMREGSPIGVSFDAPHAKAIYRKANRAGHDICRPSGDCD